MMTGKATPSMHGSDKGTLFSEEEESSYKVVRIRIRFTRLTWSVTTPPPQLHPGIMADVACGRFKYTLVVRSDLFRWEGSCNACSLAPNRSPLTENSCR